MEKILPRPWLVADTRIRTAAAWCLERMREDSEESVGVELGKVFHFSEIKFGQYWHTHGRALEVFPKQFDAIEYRLLTGEHPQITVIVQIALHHKSEEIFDWAQSAPEFTHE